MFSGHTVQYYIPRETIFQFWLENDEDREKLTFQSKATTGNEKTISISGIDRWLQSCQVNNGQNTRDANNAKSDSSGRDSFASVNT